MRELNSLERLPTKWRFSEANGDLPGRRLCPESPMGRSGIHESGNDIFDFAVASQEPSGKNFRAITASPF
jgi:hypothetical protein